MKRMLAVLLCTAMLVSAMGCSGIDQLESSAGSSQPPQTGSTVNSSVELGEAKLLWAEQLTICLIQHGLTAETRRTCETLTKLSGILSMALAAAGKISPMMSGPN